MNWYPGKVSKWLAYFQIRAENEQRAMENARSKARNKPRVRRG